MLSQPSEKGHLLSTYHALHLLSEGEIQTDRHKDSQCHKDWGLKIRSDIQLSEEGSEESLNSW